ncbi:LytR family transcriptional regulator, partial [Geodermatophilus sp. CPCC 206100]
MGDERTRDDAENGRGAGRFRGRRRPPAQPAGREPITVEQLIAKQGSEVGRRRAARTGEIPIPLAPGEQPPAHRRGLPPVPGEDPRASGPEARPPREPRSPREAVRGPGDEAAPGPRDEPRGLPPLPAADRGGVPSAAPPRAGLPPVPPSVRPSVPLFPPLEDRPGYRPSRPISPLPPIPGRDVAPAWPSTRPWES